LKEPQLSMKASGKVGKKKKGKKKKKKLKTAKSVQFDLPPEPVSSVGSLKFKIAPRFIEVTDVDDEFDLRLAVPYT